MAHKRQISKAIPRNERANVPEDEQAEEQEALRVPQEGLEGTRKSTRVKKAKQLD